MDPDAQGSGEAYIGPTHRPGGRGDPPQRWALWLRRNVRPNIPEATGSNKAGGKKMDLDDCQQQQTQGKVGPRARCPGPHANSLWGGSRLQHTWPDDPPLLHPTSATIADPAPRKGWEGLVETKRLHSAPHRKTQKTTVTGTSQETTCRVLLVYPVWACVSKLPLTKTPVSLG